MRLITNMTAPLQPSTRARINLGLAITAFVIATAISTRIGVTDNTVPLATFYSFLTIALAFTIRVGIYIDSTLPPATGPTSGEPDPAEPTPVHSHQP